MQKEKTETPLEHLNRFAAESPTLKQISGKILMLELAQNETVIDITEDELMDFINAEIKAYREEKIAEMEKRELI